MTLHGDRGDRGGHDDVLWSVEGEAELYLDRADALRNWIESFSDLGRIPETVRLLSHRRMAHPPVDAYRLVEGIFEDWDEVVGCPWAEERQRPTEGARNIAEGFVKALRRHYVVWACEPDGYAEEFTRKEAFKLAGIVYE